MIKTESDEDRLAAASVTETSPDVVSAKKKKKKKTDKQHDSD